MGLMDQLKKENQGQSEGKYQAKSFDPYDQIGGAEPSQRSVYPLPGVYPALYCEQLKLIQSKNTGDTMFIAEFLVLESQVAERPSGTSMTWISNLRHQSAAGNVREFLAVLTNSTIEEIDAESARFVTSDKNPLRGRLVRLEASTTKTKKGGDFTVCKWVSIPDKFQEKAEDLRREVTDIPF